MRSQAFEVGKDLLWQKTARPAYRFFYYQRCGMEIPGFHKPCHLDDATDPGHTQQWDLTGGWHDAGDYNKYHNAPYVLGLAWSYEREQALFDSQDEDKNGRGDFLDEILWGADHATKMIAPDGSAYGPISAGYGFWGPPEIETDNKPLTGDERPTSGPGSDPAVHAAAVAKAAKFTKDAKYIEAAARALQYCLDRNQKGPLQFSAAIDLYLATNDEKYAQLAREMAPSIGGGEVDALELYDRVFKEDHSAKIREALKAEAESLLANARNPFGVWTFGPPEKPNFFGTPEKGEGWHVGNSERMFQAASRMALAYRYNPDPHYLEYIYDQFNWTLGVNPYNISLMEGVGKTFPPSYHQRLTFAGVPRGAVPGSVVNGITFMAPGDDRPYFDMRGLDIPSFESNEVWLPHNTAFLNALTGLEEIHRAENMR
jgi:endoglucanase